MNNYCCIEQTARKHDAPSPDSSFVEFPYTSREYRTHIDKLNRGLPQGAGQQPRTSRVGKVCVADVARRLRGVLTPARHPPPPARAPDGLSDSCASARQKTLRVAKKCVGQGVLT